MTRQRLDTPPPAIELPITPMLDMTFQLLVFFVLTFRPSTALEQALDLRIPASPTVIGQPGGDPPPENQPPPDGLDEGVTLIARTAPYEANPGGLAFLDIKTAQGKRVLNDARALREYLSQTRPDLKDDIRISAERGLKYAFVIELMDVCLQAGFTRIGFAPPTDN